MLQESSNHPTGVEATATPPRRRAILVVLATIVLCAIAILVVRPLITHWFNVCAAYRNLSHQDESERMEAVRWLIDNGENPDEALFALLDDSDEGVRIFAAGELEYSRPLTDRTIETFLARLESGSPVQSAPNLFYRHAEQATGPLTPAEQRMIAALRRLLLSKNPYESRNAAITLAAFLHRDPSLSETVKGYLKSAGIFFQLPVAREIARDDPAYRDEYVRLLLSGASSGNADAERMAIYDLKELQRESDGFVTELEARRAMTSDPQEVSRLDRAFKLLKSPADDAK